MRKYQVQHPDALPFDYFERSAEHCADLNGRSLQQSEEREDGGTEQLLSWLAEGAAQLTQCQRLYIDAYYNQGSSMQRIAEMHSVARSTVSRGLNSGMVKLQDWISDKRLLDICSIDGQVLRWDRFLRGVTCLSARQRQLLLMIRTGRFHIQSELAECLGLDKSTVSRTIERGARKLTRLGVPVNQLGWTHLRNHSETRRDYAGT